MRALLPRIVATGVAPLLLWVAPVAVECGYPSPAQDYYDGPLNLTASLIDDPAATFVVAASGEAMVGAGISDGDQLLVDRSKRPSPGDIVVAVLDGEFTVARLEVGRSGVVLRAEQPGLPDVCVAELSELNIWGVARYCLHPLRQPPAVREPGEGPLDLAKMLVDDPAATFVVRASGDSMTGAGISDRDELLVDRSKRPCDRDIVVAVLDGELTLKRLEVGAHGIVLRAENSAHPDIVVAELSELNVWGVATYCIHHLR